MFKHALTFPKNDRYNGKPHTYKSLSEVKSGCDMYYFSIYARAGVRVQGYPVLENHFGERVPARACVI
jgi:hypothetical protein